MNVEEIFFKKSKKLNKIGSALLTTRFFSVVGVFCLMFVIFFKVGNMVIPSMGEIEKNIFIVSAAILEVIIPITVYKAFNSFF